MVPNKHISSNGFLGLTNCFTGMIGQFTSKTVFPTEGQTEPPPAPPGSHLDLFMPQLQGPHERR